jgi:hypothetical protein
VQRRTLHALVLLAAAGTALVGRRAAAQAVNTLSGIPSEMFPPPGTCRIWLDGVSPTRQPPLMDCAAAQQNAPANSRVVYGVTARRTEELTGTGTVDRRPPDGVDRRPPNLPTAPQGDPTGAGCSDGDGNGFCDEMRLPVSPPADLPRMSMAYVYARFRGRSGDVERWLGRDIPLEVRYVDADRNNEPERVEWFTPDGTRLQVWVDANRDGRADQVGIYRAGRIARVLGRP